MVGEKGEAEILNGVHKPTFSSDAHGNLRTKIETGTSQTANCVSLTVCVSLTDCASLTDRL